MGVAAVLIATWRDAEGGTSSRSRGDLGCFPGSRRLTGILCEFIIPIHNPDSHTLVAPGEVKMDLKHFNDGSEKKMGI